MKSILIILIALPFMSYSQDGKDYIEVTGQAEVRFVPDLIYLRIHIAEDDKDLPDLQKKEKEIVDRLVNVGIDPAKDLAILDLASNFRYRVFAKNDIIHSKEYILLVRTAALANKVIVSLEEIKISNVKIDHLDHTKMTDFKRQCMVLAIEAARAKADAIVGAIGQTAGRAIYIDEELPITNPYGNNVRHRQDYAFKTESSTSPQTYLTDLDFDEIKLEYHILARFELK